MGAGVTTRMLPLVIALTRGWLRAYTCQMPRHLAESRRAEIESDLWEMQHDRDLTRGRASGSIALARLIKGIPCDIAWRFDNAAFEQQLIVRRMFALAAATLLVLSLWSVPPMFLHGDRDMAACAATAPMPHVRADLLHEVVRCTGVLFSSPRARAQGPS